MSRALTDASCPANRSRPSRLHRAAHTTLLALGLTLTAGVFVGCETKSFIDPTELVDPDTANQLSADGTAQPRIQPILSELDLGVTRDEVAFSSARDVQARDLEVDIQDYLISATDLLRVTIQDFPAPGQPFTDGFKVSETGLITLPDVGQVRVAGLTESEATAAIERAYRDAGILVNPQVSVLVVEAYGRVFSVLGAIAQPGRYTLLKSDFRMLDALSLARGGGDFRTTSEYAYVVRSTAPRQRPPVPPQQPQQPPQNGGTDPLAPGSDPLAPRSSADQPVEQVGEPTEESLATYALAQGQPQGGQGFQFQAPQATGDREIIRVPLKELLSGALQYHIIIKPEDTIIVPDPVTGEYYVGGHVVTPGAFAILPGRQLTVKQAIITSRMLDPVAVPQRTQLIRRVGDQDVFVRINLAKIFVGQEPDIYLEPNDTILVGTNFFAPFIASIRNGFRVTYGFGFLYDRNFAVDRNVQRF